MRWRRLLIVSAVKICLQTASASGGIRPRPPNEVSPLNPVDFYPQIPWMGYSFQKKIFGAATTSQGVWQLLIHGLRVWGAAHGERRERTYNGGLRGAEPPEGSSSRGLSAIAELLVLRCKCNVSNLIFEILKQVTWLPSPISEAQALPMQIASPHWPIVRA